MTLVTGTVQDLGYDGMEGTLWARPARFRSDGQVVYAPERKPFKITGGVVSADLAPGPAVLELQVGSHARGTFEVVIPDTDITLADLLDTVFPWEPAQVSLFVAEREAAEQAKADAEQAATLAGTAKTGAELAAQQTGQDRSHVDQVRTELDEAFDASTAGNVLPPRLTETALNATYGPITARTVSAYAHGVRPGASGPAQNAALHSAFAAAESAGGGGTVEVPAGIIPVDGTFSLAGYSSGIVGSGSTYASPSEAKGTTFRATNQTGPVLDLRGFAYPSGQRGKVRFSDFTVEGDNTAGAVKEGIHIEGGSALYVSNVTTHRTGGPGLVVKDHYLSDFISVIVCNPVNAAADDVPYVLLDGANGNRFLGLGLRALVFDNASPSCGVSGALRLISTGVFTHHKSLFSGCWVENLWAPTGAAFIVSRAIDVVFSDTQFFDVFKAPGATDTSYFRLEPTDVSNLGGTIIRGLIPGNDQGSANSVDIGVDMQQKSAHVSGTKGYRRNHVKVRAGVTGAYVHLAAGPGANVDNPSILDEANSSTNTLIDAARGTYSLATTTSFPSMKLGGRYITDLVNDLGTVTSNWAANLAFGHNIFKVTLGGNVTMGGVTNDAGQTGRELTLMVKQDATGGRLVTSWHSRVKFAGGVAPTLSTAPGKTDIFTFVFDGTVWLEKSRSLGL